MERLKGNVIRVGVFCEHVFTFQYGEIKSFNADKFASGICKFTFQYGEIKSDTIINRIRKGDFIYIPVWRD